MSAQMISSPKDEYKQVGYEGSYFQCNPTRGAIESIKEDFVGRDWM